MQVITAQGEAEAEDGYKSEVNLSHIAPLRDAQPDPALENKSNKITQAFRNLPNRKETSQVQCMKNKFPGAENEEEG